jgi:hypothetical protein
MTLQLDLMPGAGGRAGALNGYPLQNIFKENKT